MSAVGFPPVPGLTYHPEDHRKEHAHSSAAAAASLSTTSTVAAASGHLKDTVVKVDEFIPTGYPNPRALDSDGWNRYILWLNFDNLRLRKGKKFDPSCTWALRIDLESRKNALKAEQDNNHPRILGEIEQLERQVEKTESEKKLEVAEQNLNDMREMQKWVERLRAAGVPVSKENAERVNSWFNGMRDCLKADFRLYRNVMTHFFKQNSVQHLSVCFNSGWNKTNAKAVRDDTGNMLFIDDNTFVHVFTIQDCGETVRGSYHRKPSSGENPDYALAVQPLPPPRASNEPFEHARYTIYDSRLFSRQTRSNSCGCETFNFEFFQILRANLDRIQKKNGERLAHLESEAASNRVLLPVLMRIVIDYTGIKDYGILPPEARPGS